MAGCTLENIRNFVELLIEVILFAHVAKGQVTAQQVHQNGHHIAPEVVAEVEHF
jgi:hypothetical protein